MKTVLTDPARLLGRRGRLPDRADHSFSSVLYPVFPFLPGDLSASSSGWASDSSWAASPGATRSRLNHVLDRVTSRVSAAALVVTSIGLIVGLGVGALISLAVKDLPVVGVFLPPLVYRGLSATCSPTWRTSGTPTSRASWDSRTCLAGQRPRSRSRRSAPKILDTSVIIDGANRRHRPDALRRRRPGHPQFVLDELQSIADSAEPLQAGARSPGTGVRRRSAGGLRPTWSSSTGTSRA